MNKNQYSASKVEELVKVIQTLRRGLFPRTVVNGETTEKFRKGLIARISETLEGSESNWDESYLRICKALANEFKRCKSGESDKKYFRLETIHRPMNFSRYLSNLEIIEFDVDLSKYIDFNLSVGGFKSNQTSLFENKKKLDQDEKFHDFRREVIDKLIRAVNSIFDKFGLEGMDENDKYTKEVVGNFFNKVFFKETKDGKFGEYWKNKMSMIDTNRYIKSYISNKRNDNDPSKYRFITVKGIFGVHQFNATVKEFNSSMVRHTVPIWGTDKNGVRAIVGRKVKDGSIFLHLKENYVHRFRRVLTKLEKEFYDKYSLIPNEYYSSYGRLPDDWREMRERNTPKKKNNQLEEEKEVKIEI